MPVNSRQQPPLFIDLSLTVHPGLRGVEFAPKHRLEKDGWNSSTLELYSHSGTHMDAPVHFGCGKQTIDQLNPNRFVSKAWLIRIHDCQPSQLLDVDLIESISAEFEAGDSIVFQTGWSKHVCTPEIYRDQLPRISEALATWCVEHKVNILGVEPPSIADVNHLPEVTKIHQILLGGDVIIVEGLCDLEAIKSDSFLMIATPLKIENGDGCPCRVLAAPMPDTEPKTKVFSMEDLAFRTETISADILTQFPETIHPPLRANIRSQLAEMNAVIAVLDDDPTGTQTVQNTPVYSSWNDGIIENEIQSGSGLFYLMTNSRALNPKDAYQINIETAKSLKKAAKEANKTLIVVSRGDSTLRGYYPLEVDALECGLELSSPVHVIVPFFEEGGRHTIEDIHYVREGDQLVPAGKTPFAKDATFGYQNSNLKNWVAEKSDLKIKASDVDSIDIETIRSSSLEELLKKVEGFHGKAMVLNAAVEQDLEPTVLTLLKCIEKGGSYLFRSAASLVRVMSGQNKVPLLTKEDLKNPDGIGGLVVVGSYVPKSTQQLQLLLDTPDICAIQVEVERLIGSPGNAAEYITSLSEQMNAALQSDQTAVIYTSRKLVTGTDKDDSLSINVSVSDALVDLVKKLKSPPRFLIAKGGITSCDLARYSLEMKEANVAGQLLPGVPVWTLGKSSKFPGLNYVVFPGNVGQEDSLKQAVAILS